MAGGTAIAATAAPIVGGMIGNMMAAGDRANAANYAQSAFQELLNLGYPPDLSQEVIYKEFQKAGVMTPELESHIQLMPSKVAAIQEDKGLLDTQRDALNLIKERAQGGLSAEDRAAFNELRDQVNREENARQGQILQNMQARGMGGSGAELIAALNSSQAATNRASSASDRLAAESARKALEAAAQSGTLASQIRGQDFDVNKAKASAEDEFQRFNVQNQIAQQQRNIDRMNQAQMTNLANEQDISNKNTGLYNQEQYRQNYDKRDYWNDLAKRAQLRSGAYQGLSDQATKSADRTANMFTGIGNAIGTGVGAYAKGSGTTPAGLVNPNKVNQGILDPDSSSAADEAIRRQNELLYGKVK